jgi:hypothetical protein
MDVAICQLPMVRSYILTRGNISNGLQMLLAKDVAVGMQKMKSLTPEYSQ